MPSLEDDSTNDQRQESMNEVRLPPHHRLDLYVRRCLAAPSRIEVKDKQGRCIELFVHRERGEPAKAAVPSTHQTEVVAFGHFGAQFFLMWICSCSFDQKRLASVFGGDRDFSIERADANEVALPVCFVHRASESPPPQSRDRSAFHLKQMMGFAVPFAQDHDFARAHEVALELFTGSRR